MTIIKTKLELNQIYFISDLHLYHSGVIKFSERPFPNVEEMNIALITNIMTTINPMDDHILFIVGDLALDLKSPQKEDLLEKWKLLEGYNIRLVLGNHDRSNESFYVNSGMFTGVHTDVFLNVKCHNLHFHTYHFPLDSWDKRHYGQYHIHGHTHSKEIYNYKVPKRYNVCAEALDYRPWSLYQLLEAYDHVGAR